MNKVHSHTIRLWMVVIIVLILPVLACGTFSLPNQAAVTQPAAQLVITQVVAPTAAINTSYEPLTSEEATLIELYQRVNPSVVNLTVFAATTTDELAPFSQGSGFVYDSAGHIVTNAHVVHGAERIEVNFYDGRTRPAELVGVDLYSDLAVVQVADLPESVAGLPLGDMDQLAVGQTALAIGNPFGFNGTLTRGIISALGRTIEGLTIFNIPQTIQTDAPINPGNSGGPLFNTKGEVVGINTAIVPNGQGIGFAIPVNVAKPLIPQLISKGEVTRGYIGVSIQAITPELAKAMNLKDAKGALVSDVVPGSPADKGGMKQGDVITAFNQKNIDRPRDLSSWVAQTPVGQEAKVAILREGGEKQLTLKIEKFGSEEAKVEKSVPSDQGKWGLGLEDLSPQMKGLYGPKGSQGVLVANVQPGSPADLAGVRSGDILLSVNRQPVNSINQAVEVISQTKDDDSLLFLLRRDEGTFFAALAK